MFDKRSDSLKGGRAYLSLGSNIGDRETAVLRAIGLLEDYGAGWVAATSSLYETEPVECRAMDNFVNAVVELHTLLGGVDLLKRVQSVERALGRSGGHSEPRELDVDIVTLGDCVMQTESLTIPHARYRQRAFVLVPLQEVAPDFRCPVTGTTVKEMLDGLQPLPEIRQISSRRLVGDAQHSPMPQRHVY